MKHFLRLAILITLFFKVQSTVWAQSTPEKKYELVFLAGTIQPILLQGWNVEVDFYTPKMVFNYSHGFSLELESKTGTTVGAAKEQHLAFHLPYSTGFGIGYRLHKYFDVRFEPKLHRFEVYYDGTNRRLQENQVTNYSTVTLGVGVYFRWKPFEKQDNFLRGIFTSTSLRYWQNVYSSLEGGEVSYENKVTGENATHKTANIGMANTPFLFNIGIGYSIEF
ncbi:MAG: hypothetical protein ACRBFS_14970 [Aureispira sp.]